jgi:hypothetical protein
MIPDHYSLAIIVGGNPVQNANHRAVGESQLPVVGDSVPYHSLLGLAS